MVDVQKMLFKPGMVNGYFQETENVHLYYFFEKEVTLQIQEDRNGDLFFCDEDFTAMDKRLKNCTIANEDSL